MIKIFNEDCLEGMKRIPDGSVDMVLCDPPFNITDCEFDKALPLPLLWEQVLRVSKLNAAMLFFTIGKFTIEFAASQLNLYRYEWIWRKNLATGFLNAKKMPLRAHENILVFYRKLPTYNPQLTEGEPYKRVGLTGSDNYQAFKGGIKRWKELYNDGWRYPVDIQEFKQPYAGGAGDKSHPTQKPVDLLEYLIHTYTNEGEVVLDCTMGSGSTGVACMNTGRKFIGFETEKKFFDIAKKRITEALALKQQELFKLE